ncbi:MAG: response regulator transcription factor [Anaerolineaceae bacterium]|nr:response regulator transcription factor [Anaerolineaceae bacterium]
MKHLVLLIEGKRVDRPSYMAGLSKKGFVVESVINGAAAIKKLHELKPNAVIIDAASMRTTGTRICASIRNIINKTPIILILAANAKKIKNTCADEVLYLPFTLQKLLNRLRPYMGFSKNKKLVCGPIKLDLKDHWVICGNKKTRLTPRLFMLIEFLMRKPGEILLREDLFRTLWETDYLGDMRSLDVHISWLRKAIEEDPRHPKFIKTERGIGYRLEIEKPHRPKKKPEK